VADGQTVWLYDADLNQVTARKQAQVISATPAALISAAPDLQVLKKEFALQGEPDADGLKWLRATPLQADSAIKTVRMAFQNSPALTLAVLEIHDSLGQTSRIQFARFELNPTLPSDSFQFKTPPGAQVLWP
jgi:outer membrane lipoprotein carrier protein